MRTNSTVHGGIEVTGRGIPVALEAFGGFTVLAGQMLMANGISQPDRNGFIQVDLDGWYPLDNYLKTYREIEAQFGEAVVRRLGAATAKHARFPSYISDVNSAMRLLDVGYHMNHRRQGRIMFDPATGTMLEGIGHYRCQHVPGERRVLMQCENPYPCAFDEGLIEAMAQRFSLSARLVHQQPASCRRKGGSSCLYLVTW